MRNFFSQKIRLAKIYVAGRYKLLKRVHKWRMGQIFRDLQILTPVFLQQIMEKYGNADWTLTAEGTDSASKANSN